MTPITREQAEANKADREMAEEMVNFLASSFNWNGATPDQTEQRPRFWEEVIKLCKAKLPATHELNKVSTGNKQEAMSYEDAMYFGGTYFPRGIYSEQGTETCPIRDCPAWYVNQWAHGDDFTQSLRKYVASEYFRNQPELKAHGHVTTEPSRS